MTTQTNWAYWIAGQAGVIPLALGMPGVAKTETARALATAAGRQFLPLMLDQLLPEDLGGFPTIGELTHDGATHPVMRRLHDERFLVARLTPSVLLIDELTNTAHSTQAAALQLIAEGIPGCWIFAAANPPQQAAAGVELTPPMVNRLCVLQWEIDRSAILAGLRAGLNFPAPSVPILPDDWRAQLAQWGGLVADFLDRYPDLLAAFPRDPNAAGNPFPSPRAWTNTAKLLAAAASVGADSPTQSALVTGTVGLAAGTQFLTWLKTQSIPDPEAILANPSSLKLPPRGDLAIATLGAIMGRIRAHKTPDRWEQAGEVVAVAYRQSQELATAVYGSWWREKPDGYRPRPSSPELAELNASITGAGR